MAGLTLRYLQRASPIASPFWTEVARNVGHAMFGRMGTARLVVEGRENIPGVPAIFAPNHTHSLDALPLRYYLLNELEAHLMTWVKARVFADPRQEWFFRVTGCVPIASRGYIIAADFAQVMGRRPRRQEYRLLRAHVDEDVEASDYPELRPLFDRARDMLGVMFIPSRVTYREAVLRTYHTFMEETLRIAAIGRDAGRHQHIYPQGATSSRLTPGRIGAVQAALALDVPIVPVGISGARRAFRTTWPFGTVTVRFGAPCRVPPDLVPRHFVPFSPDAEAAQRETLLDWTDSLMERINELIEPELRWADDKRSDGKTGVERFY